ncbi:uncharacterized protein PAE49_012510 [Odontesthes bonariensis]|uniref:uncharacterized protein LOC142391747 n=1 Tax=Odontesthes bonariensis TaxID=219752 RepID=UPI003F588761
MDERKRWFVLLLPLCLGVDTEETVVKKVGKEPDVTPLCSSARVQIITRIVCKIKTKWSGDGCRLLYQHGQNFKNECNSKFTLMTQNETAFLLLTNLTPEDGGIGTCECSHVHGTDTLHLLIIVKDLESNTSLLTMLTSTTIISTAAGFLIITGLFLGLILRKSHCRGSTQSRQAGLTDENKQGDLYERLQQPASDLYQTASPMCHRHAARDDTVSTDWVSKTESVPLEQEANATQTDEICELYVNM